MATTPPISLPSIYKSIAAPAGANPADVQSAQDQMAMQFAPQENSITNTINQIQGYLDRDVNAQQQYGQNADTAIQNVGQQVQQQLQGNVGAIGNIYQGAGQQVGGIFDTAQAQVQGAGQSIQDRLSGLANQLGQGQALKADPYGNDPISRLMAQQASAQTRLAGTKANDQGALATLGASLQGIAQKAVGDSVAEYGQKRADLATNVLKTISQLQLDSNQSIMDQLHKYSDLAETEGPAFRQLITTAASNRSAIARQNALDQIDAMYKQSQMDKNEATAQKALAGSDPNSLDNQLKQVDLATKLKALGNSNSYVDDATGQQNLMDFINDLRVNQKALTGTQYAGIQNFINQNAGAASALNQNPYEYLVGLAQQKTGTGNLVQTPKSAGSKYGDANYQVPLQVLLDALGKRYTGVASTSSKIGTSYK